MSSDSETEYDFTRHKREELKFKGFRQLIDEMKVSSLHDIYNSERTQKSLEDTNTYTYDALMKWKDDDRTLSFHNAFYSIRKYAMSLPLLIVNLDEIMETLLFHLQLKDSLATHSLLDITTQIIRDVRDLFIPHIPKLLNFCRNKLVGCSDTAVIYDIFNTLSFMIKYLHSKIMEDSNSFLSHYIYFLCHKKEYVRTFASESLVYLLHKLTPEDFIRFIDDIASNYIISEMSVLGVSEKNLLTRGLGVLLFENVKGVKGQLIIKSKQYLKLYFEKLIDDTSPTNGIWFSALQICNKAISIQKREGFDDYFVLLKSVLPQQPTTQQFYGKVLSIVIRWVMYRYGKTIESCESDVEDLLKYTFKCTISTPQHLETIPLLADNYRFSAPLLTDVVNYVNYVSNEELRRLLAETTKQFVYFTAILKEMIRRNDINSLHHYFPLRYTPTIFNEDCDIVTQHFPRFPVSLINDLASCLANKELTDDLCCFIVATDITSIVPNVLEKALNYFEKSPLAASVILAHFENPIEERVISYLKSLRTSQHLFALAYYVQQRKITVNFSAEEKNKIMKLMESKHALERSASAFLLVGGDELRSRQIMSIFNDIEISIAMIRPMLARLDYMKSRISVGNNETAEMIVHFSLGLLQIKLSRLWQPAKELIGLCVEKDKNFIQIVMNFIEEFHSRNQKNIDNGDDDVEEVEKQPDNTPIIFNQYPLSLTDGHTISNYLWEIVADNVSLIKAGKYHEWFISQFVKRYESVDVAVLSKKGVETLSHYIGVLKHIPIPNHIISILIHLLSTTRIELQTEIFSAICTTDPTIDAYKKDVVGLISSLNKPSQLRNCVQTISVSGKALSLLCRMLFVHIVQKAVEKSTKKVLIEFISQIEDEARTDFLNDTISAFFDFVSGKKKFARGELDYILHTLHIINSTFGSLCGENSMIGKLLVEILKKDPVVTWDVLRLINGFSQAADDGDTDPNKLFDFKQIYPIVLDKSNLKLSQFVVETLMVLPNANELLHSIPKLIPFLYHYENITPLNVDRILDLHLMIQDIPVPFDCSSLVAKIVNVVLPNITEKYISFVQFIIRHTTLKFSELLRRHVPLATQLLLPFLQTLSDTDESMAVLAELLVQEPNALVEQSILPKQFDCELGNRLIQCIHTPKDFFSILKTTETPTGRLLLFVSEYACQMVVSSDYTIGEISSAFLLKLFKQTKLPNLIPRLLDLFMKNATLPIANLLTNCLLIEKTNGLSELASVGFFKGVVNTGYEALDATKTILSKLNENELDITRRICSNSMENQTDKKARIKLNEIVGGVYSLFSWGKYEERVNSLIEFLKESNKKRENVVALLEEAQANERKDDIKIHSRVLEQTGRISRVRFIELRSAIYNFHFEIGGEFDVRELNSFAAFGDLPFEITDEDRVELEMTQQRTYRQCVMLKIIPGLSELMADKNVGNKKSDIVRMIVELLCKLPEEMRRLEVPQMIQLIVNELQEKTFEPREIARKQLVEILWKLGDSYFADIVDELYNGLHKGFMKHVLGYTVEFLLRSIVKKVYNQQVNENLMEEEKKDVDDDLEETTQQNGMEEVCDQFKITSSIDTLLKVVYDDIYGPVAEQREVGKIRNSIVEARECKSFQTFEHIGLLVDQIDSLGKINIFVETQLKQAKKLQVALEMDRLMREFEKGLKENKFISKEILYDFAVSTIKSYYYVPQLADVLITPKIKLAGQNAKDRIMYQREKNALEMMENGVVDKKQHYHILVEFGLKLLGDCMVSAEENDKLLGAAESLAKKCCFMKHERSISLAVKILRSVLKKRDRMEEGYSVGCKIIKSLQKTDVELYSQAMMLMTDLIKRCDEKFKPQDLQTVLDVIVTNITETTKFTSNFIFLNAIMKKGIVHPTLYDIMLDYGKYLIQTTEIKTKKEAEEILITFLTKYPLSPKQRKMYIEFFIKNIDFDQVESRIAIAELLTIVIDRMDATEANEGVNFIFIPIALRISVEENKKAKEKQIRILQSFITKISKEQFNKVLGMNKSWMNNSKATIRRVGWIGNYLCIDRLKKKKEEFMLIIGETYLKEENCVREEMIRFCSCCECNNQNIFENILDTPQVNGAVEFIGQVLFNIENITKVIKVLVEMVLENQSVVEWTKTIKKIVEKDDSKIVELMNYLGERANENSVKMVASLIGSVEQNENYIGLIVKYLFPIANGKDKTTAPLAKEVMNIIKTIVEPERYLTLIQKD